MKIIVQDDNGSQQIVAIGYDNPDRALEAHGYDPESVEYTVEKSVAGRVADLERANGVNEDENARGIAHRIDDLEDRVEALESE